MPPPQAQVIPDLPKYHLFEGLAPRERDLIFAGATLRKISANSVVTTQGTPAERLFLLISGCMRMFYTTTDGRKILLIWLAPGDVIGGASVIATKRQYIVSSEAVKDSELLVWDRATFRRFIEEYPLLLDNALTIAGEYFNWYMGAHVALTCYTARERLGHVLLGLSRAIGEKVPGGIEIDVTNEDLANSANITPYTASRLMSEWQKSRAIAKRRGKVLLRSPERLLLTTV
jgi:CRP-like cAMP-binding protein